MHKKFISKTFLVAVFLLSFISYASAVLVMCDKKDLQRDCTTYCGDNFDEEHVDACDAACNYIADQCR